MSTIDPNASNARDELRAAARQRGFEIVLEVEETGSGARNDRPGLQRVMTAARKVDVVLVHKLDRFGRSAFDLLANICQLGDAGCRFIACTHGLHVKAGGDPLSRFVPSVLGGVAESSAT